MIEIYKGSNFSSFCFPCFHNVKVFQFSVIHVKSGVDSLLENESSYSSSTLRILEFDLELIESSSSNLFSRIRVL